MSSLHPLAKVNVFNAGTCTHTQQYLTSASPFHPLTDAAMSITCTRPESRFLFTEDKRTAVNRNHLGEL